MTPLQKHYLYKGLYSPFPSFDWEFKEDIVIWFPKFLMDPKP